MFSVDLNKFKKILPTRKSNMGRSPSIGTDKVETKFNWHNAIECLNREMMAELMGLAMELAVVFFFENFTYTFGGNVYRQARGGPIGARLTMAVARIVMQDWKESYDEIIRDKRDFKWFICR